MSIYACHAVRDYDRAVEWCDHLIAYTERFHLPTLLGYCRTRYADILQWRGRWSEAESQLDAARRIFAEKRPSLSSDALARLGELRRRQVRLAVRQPPHLDVELAVAPSCDQERERVVPGEQELDELARSLAAGLAP